MDENIRKKERTIGIIMAVIMSIAMGVIAAVVISGNPNAKTPPFPVFCAINVLESVIVGLFVAYLIPLAKIGRALCERAGAVPPSRKFHLINAIPMAVGNAVIVSGVVSFINVSEAHSSIPAEQAPPLLIMWLSSWLPLLIPGIIAGYVLAIILAPIVSGMVMGERR